MTQNINDAVRKILEKNTSELLLDKNKLVFNSTEATEELVQFICDLEAQTIYDIFKIANVHPNANTIHSLLMNKGSFRPMQIEKAIHKLTQLL